MSIRVRPPKLALAPRGGGIKPPFFALSKIGQALRWVYNFDGATNRGVFANRLISVDSDIDIEWRQVGVPSSGIRSIVGQSNSATFSQREFSLRFDAGKLTLVVGGSLLISGADNLNVADGKWRVRVSGSNVQAFFNDVKVLDANRARGAAREVSAVTVIGARSHDGNFVEYTHGRLFDVRINGVLYPLNEQNQQIQLPWPRRLGGELLPAPLLVSVVSAGVVNNNGAVTFTDVGSWGGCNIPAQSGLIPGVAYLIEFDVQLSQGRWGVRLGIGGSAGQLFEGSNSGRIRLIATANPSNTGLQLFSRQAPTSAVFSNFSLRPLWVANATELVANSGLTGATATTVPSWTPINSAVFSYSAGALVITNSAALAGAIHQNLTLDAGADYVVSVVFRGGNTTAKISVNGGGHTWTGSLVNVPNIAMNSTFTQVIKSSGIAANIAVFVNTQAQDSFIEVQSISVRKLDSLCSPLTLVNTTSPGWQQVDAPPLPLLRWIYNFDGATNRGTFANRLINPDGDNFFEFWTPNPGKSVGIIIAQNITEIFNNREFQLWTGSSGRTLHLLVGGTANQLGAVTPNTRYRLDLVGNVATLKDTAGFVVWSVPITRGAFREPTASTHICANMDKGVFTNFFMGPQRDIVINGVRYPIDELNQTIQLPSPNGLGAELITRSRLENPAVKGSQWTYLGDGRWQLIGDGELNDLRFLSNQDHPSAGLLEFEIESISGAIRTSVLGLARSVFSTAGKHRYFYTDLNEGGAGGAAVVFRRHTVGVPASCVIKNISFKPLGTCNPLTLSNTTSPGWQEIEA